MIHLPHLIHDLGVILITAAITTILFKALRQPLVLGYLVAGFLVSPHVSFLPTVVDHEGIKVWAEIGVIFLLFNLGLEFSFRKLMRVGSSGSITAVVEVIFMVGLGYLTGRALGWNPTDSLFLGGVLSISSTTIIIRALEELKMKGRGFVSFVFAVLVVEDLVAILLLVLLSTLAVTQAFSGWDLVVSTLRLGFMILLWFVAGVYFLPLLFRRIKGFLTDETRLIISIGFCLGMVILATRLGFSPALGAFMMGSLIAETDQGRKVEHILMPVRDLFAAVFFVSVGMMIDPASLTEHFGVILIVTLVTIGGKLVSTVTGALLSGQSLRHSVQAGLSLAQIGEFSFIIATLGLTLKITSDFLYPIAVAVSAITTFSTPYLIRSADPLCAWIERKMPERFLRRLSQYQQALRRKEGRGLLREVWRGCGTFLILNSVVILGIFLLVRLFLSPVLVEAFDEGLVPRFLTGSLAFVLCLPFFWALLRRNRRASAGAAGGFDAKKIRIVEILLRFAVAGVLLGFLVYVTTGFGGAAVYLLIGIPVIAILGSKFAGSLYGQIEDQFLMNLAGPGEQEGPERPPLAPWDATLAHLTLSPHSPLVMQSLLDSGLREKFGVIVAMIERGGKPIFAPGRSERLLPFDVLALIGSDEQIRAAQAVIEAVREPQESEAGAFRLEPVLLNPQSPFVGKKIRESGLREMVRGLVVGLERDGQRILNPDSATVLEPGDLLWIVGDRNEIVKLGI